MPFKLSDSEESPNETSSQSTGSEVLGTEDICMDINRYYPNNPSIDIESMLSPSMRQLVENYQNMSLEEFAQRAQLQFPDGISFCIKDGITKNVTIQIKLDRYDNVTFKRIVKVGDLQPLSWSMTYNSKTNEITAVTGFANMLDNGGYTLEESFSDFREYAVLNVYNQGSLSEQDVLQTVVVILIADWSWDILSTANIPEDFIF